MDISSLRFQLEVRAAHALLELPAPLLRRLAGPAIRRDGHTLDPQVQLVLRLQQLRGAASLRRGDVASSRRALEADALALAPPPSPMASVEALTLRGPAGPIRARLYRPPGLPSRAPALVFLHGGGYVLGSLDSHDRPCRVLAATTPCLVVAVDYRLAPEHPFPAGLEDAVAAFRDVAARAPALGIDPDRLAVGGDSAGGNLSAGVARLTRHDAARPCLQLLVYPATDMTMSFPSIRTVGEGFFLERTDMDWFIAHYLPPGQDRKDPRASPLYAPAAELRELPPAFVQTAGFDPLRDEGEAYADAMRAAGVPVEHRRYGGLFHGFFSASGGIRAARGAVADAAAALRRAFVRARRAAARVA